MHGQPGALVKSGLNVTELGFSLHAATVVGAHDRGGREASSGAVAPTGV
jgi:hypothetical protein